MLASFALVIGRIGKEGCSSLVKRFVVELIVKIATAWSCRLDWEIKYGPGRGQILLITLHVLIRSVWSAVVKTDSNVDGG